MASRGWTCRMSGCATLNSARRKYCAGCHSPRPPKKVPAHRKALRDYGYETYLELNSLIHGRGEECAICLRPPRTRRLDRDHCHTTGRLRGLLCARCNQRLERGADTEEWLGSAYEYIRRVNGYYAKEAA